MNAQQLVFLLILAATLALFISNRVRIDLAAMLTLLALSFTGILTPSEALSGFASEPAIIVAAVFVISAGLNSTGLTERIGALIARAAGSSEWRAIVIVMPAVAAMAAFSHHLMITAMMLPILMRLARTQNLPASRLLMPMSLAASLGTTLTLFSAPAFLLANNLLKRGGSRGLGLFDITPIGAALVVAGILYMSFGRWLLPRRTGAAAETDYLQLDRYCTEAKYGDVPAKKSGESADEGQLVQVVVAPHSRFIGRTIGRIDFLKTLGVVVVGLWRRAGWIRDELSRVHLREGDLLVLWGTQRRFSELAEDRGFLMMVPFAGKERRRHRAVVAIAIVIAVVAAAASGVVDVPIAFLAGAVAMIATGCVAIEQAYREIDVRIYLMIAGVIPLGLAMEKTGTAALLAHHLQNLTEGWGPRGVLMALFWAAALLTQILSDAATVVLLGPISLALAVALGLPPEPFVVCTALGAVVAFLTPIGHHGNLLILNPGQYTFGDFLRVGVPLTILISVVSVWLAYWLWLSG